MAMAWTNITSVDNHSEYLTPRMVQPNLRPSKKETIGFNLSMGSTLPRNNSPYTVNAAAMVAEHRHGQWSILYYTIR